MPAGGRAAAVALDLGSPSCSAWRRPRCSRSRAWRGPNEGAFIGPFNTVTTLTSTVPANGDVNPYGIVVVPRGVGQLVAGQLLISNFNNAGNAQGTGTTIDEISPTANPPPALHICSPRSTRLTCPVRARGASG